MQWFYNIMHVFYGANLSLKGPSIKICETSDIYNHHLDKPCAEVATLFICHSFTENIDVGSKSQFHSWVNMQ